MILLPEDDPQQEITQPLLLVDEKAQLLEFVIHFTVSIARQRPEFLLQPNPGEFCSRVKSISQILIDNVIPFTVLDLLLAKADDLRHLEKALQIVKRRVPREKESDDQVRKDLRKIINKIKPDLLRMDHTGHMEPTIRVLVALVQEKRINNLDFASYVERCDTLTDLRKMCNAAHHR